jgi:hypothetical protein
MYEFDSVSASSYEASSLAAKLTEKSADGWEVVAIVPAGSDVTAFLKRESTSSTDAATATTTAAAAAEPTVSEPAGWGSAPASTGTEASGWAAGAAATTTSAAADTGGWGATQAASAPAAAPAMAPTTPAVPAGWYTDPSGRYELRYWDGTAWTEHVSRSGQQYTDPPVA